MPAQDARDELEPEGKSADPFDLKNRRVLAANDADLDLLKTHKIAADDKALLQFLRERSLLEEDRPKVKALVAQLGASQFRLRDQAMEDLVRRGPSVLDFLRQGIAQGGDLELIRRAERCIERIRGAEVPVEAAAAIVRILGRTHPPKTLATLLAYLPYADSEYVADEIRNVFSERAIVQGKAAPDLVTALKDPVAIRRAAAGEALAKSKDQASAVRELLRDPEPVVRLRVAQAVVWSRDKAGVPVMIEALPRVPMSQGWQAEDLLLRLAEGRSPPMVSRGTDDASRKKFGEAWSAWWTKNEKAIDLARLEKNPALLGHTVVVLLDMGRIMELNDKNELVWQINGVVFPLDVQLLPNGNVLTAEYHAGRVTERDRAKGEVRWEKAVTGPLMAQRLPNRNTFIATDARLMEINEAGEEVMSFDMPNGERLMKVSKLANGEIVALTSDSRIVRMDEKGKELHSFTVNLSTKLFGGRIQMLPNGRVLVPHNSENKVVEYDSEGQIAWEVTVPQPVAATRLPNGNTLVTTMQPQTGAIEFTRAGQEVWSFRHETRVTRALRR